MITPERQVVFTLNGKSHWEGSWWKAWRVALELIAKGATRLEVS